MAERLNKRQQQNIANKHQLSCHKNIEHTVTTCIRTVNGGKKRPAEYAYVYVSQT